MKTVIRNLLRAAYLKFPLSDYYKFKMAGSLFGFAPSLFNGLPEFKRFGALTGKIPHPWENVSKSSRHALTPSEINLHTSLTPRVSIVIPVCGKVNLTLMCLQSISQYSNQIAYEVIVVDCSPDSNLDVLKEVRGIRVLSNQTHQGFIGSSNAGAATADGEYVCFLNNDTQVCESWLDELVRTFDGFSAVGIVGSKFISSNGKLQEAGGIICCNERIESFGRGEDSCHPMFNYAREVDFVSEVSLLIRKDLFDELGGFDEHNFPHNCEVVDLALKVRNKGLKVIYQPLSVVVHDEKVNADVEQRDRADQVANKHKMFERGQDVLSANETEGRNTDRAKDRGAKYRVLVLDIWTPTPDRDAGSIIALNLMLILRQMGFQVTFIPTGNFSYLIGYTQDMQRAGIEVLYGTYCTSVKQHLSNSGGRYNLVFMFRPGTVNNYLKDVRKFCPQAKVLFHTQDLHFLRMTREAELFKDQGMQKAAGEMKLNEFSIIRKVDATIVVSTTELEILQLELPDEKIYVLPLIMDVCGSGKSFNERRDIVFVGGYQHPPNTDAVLYFVSEIMPILRRHLPGVRFIVVGSNPPPEIVALASDDVVIAGFVKDLDPLLDQMRVAVAPLRYGAGIKGKIGMALALGLPTVATLCAAEGMPLSHGENILVAEGAEAFAEAVIQLYQDEVLWNKISRNGLVFAEQAWGGEAAWLKLHEILQNIDVPNSRENYPLKLYFSDSAKISAPTRI